MHPFTLAEASGGNAQERLLAKSMNFNILHGKLSTITYFCYKIRVYTCLAFLDVFTYLTNNCLDLQCSLFSSFISGISMLGIPTEVYLYGIEYCYVLIGVAMMVLLMQWIYLPVFHNLDITSTYEVSLQSLIGHSNHNPSVQTLILEVMQLIRILWDSTFTTTLSEQDNLQLRD